jgi:1-acyl-sn-glycerol-3-phosphate acyltransferase
MIVLVVLGLLFIGIPYLIHRDTIHTTLYIYTAVVLYFVAVIGITIWVGKVFRKIFLLPPYSFLEIVLSVIIYSIAIPVIGILGILSILIIILYPNSKYFVIYVLANVSVFVLGVIVIFSGSLPKEETGPFIVIPNHVSFIDYLLILITMGLKPYNVVAGSNLCYIPLLGYFLKKYTISVDRKNKQSLGKTYSEIIRELKSGKNIGIFAEGGRITEQQIFSGLILKNFKDGPFRASKFLNVKIVPVIFHGTKKYAPKEKRGWWYVSPTRIKIIFLESISPKGKTVEELKEKTYKVMFSFLTTKEPAI